MVTVQAFVWDSRKPLVQLFQSEAASTMRWITMCTMVYESCTGCSKASRVPCTICGTSDMFNELICIYLYKDCVHSVCVSIQGGGELDRWMAADGDVRMERKRNILNWGKLVVNNCTQVEWACVDCREEEE